MATNDPVAIWQQRLESNFSHDGIVGGRLLPLVMEMERRHGVNFVSQYKGHRILTDSFLDFFAVTIERVSASIRKHGWPNEAPYYSVCLQAFLTLIHSIRSSEILSTTGYPLMGFTLQRNIREQVFALGAIRAGLSSFAAVFGEEKSATAEALTKKQRKRAVHVRRDEEMRIRSLMIGQKSELPASFQAAFEVWDRVFNRQIHGSLHTFFGAAGNWLFKNTGDFSIGPKPDEDADASYINRANETNWLALRCLPYLQHPQDPLNEKWSEHWHVLDDSFRHTENELGAMGKEIAKAFAALIERRYNFGPADCYVER